MHYTYASRMYFPLFLFLFYIYMWETVIIHQFISQLIRFCVYEKTAHFFVFQWQDKGYLQILKH